MRRMIEPHTSSWKISPLYCHRTCEENSLEETKLCTIARPQRLLGWAFVHVECDPSNPASGSLAQLCPRCEKEHVSWLAHVCWLDHCDDRPADYRRFVGWMEITLWSQASARPIWDPVRFRLSLHFGLDWWLDLAV